MGFANGQYAPRSQDKFQRLARSQQDLHPVRDHLHRIYCKTVRCEARSLKSVPHLLILQQTSTILRPNSSKCESEPNIDPEPKPIPPMLPALRERHPNDPVDVLLLRAMFAGTQVDEMLKTVAAGGNADEAAKPLLALVKSLYQSIQTGTQYLRTADLEISLDKGDL